MNKNEETGEIVLYQPEGETWLADMDDKQLGEVFGLDNTLV